MKAIKINIKRLIETGYPGYAECSFYDASYNEHIVHEKIPIVTDKDLDENSKYPQEGIIACEVINEWKDITGKLIFTVNTEKPWGVNTIEGLTKFDLLEEQLTEFP